MVPTCEGHHSQHVPESICSPPSSARPREITHDLPATAFYQRARDGASDRAHTAAFTGEKKPPEWERQRSFNILTGRLFLSAQQKSRLEERAGINTTTTVLWRAFWTRVCWKHERLQWRCRWKERKETRRRRCLHGNKCNGNISTGSVADWH